VARCTQVAPLTDASRAKHTLSTHLDQVCSLRTGRHLGRKTPPLFWLAERCREHTLPYLWEQHRQHGRFTHIAYVITHIAYACQLPHRLLPYSQPGVQRCRQLRISDLSKGRQCPRLRGRARSAPACCPVPFLEVLYLCAPLFPNNFDQVRVIAGRPYSEPGDVGTRGVMPKTEYDKIADRVTAKK
jgi:hypothetical protein